VDTAPRDRRTTGVGSRTQAVGAALALVAATLLLFGALTNRELSAELEARIQRDIQTVSAHIAEELGRTGAYSSGAELERIADDAFTHTTIASVRISDDDGRALALRLRQDPSRIEDARALAISASPTSLRTSEEVLVGDDRLGWACRTPVWTGGSPQRLMGYVTVAGVDDAHGRIAGALPRAAVIAGAASLALSGVLGVWGASTLTRPIRRVADAAEALAEGRTPDDIHPAGPRETRRLAQAFNAMHRSLRDAHRRLEDSNADLEQQVHERTAQLRAVNDVLEQQMRDKNEFIRSVSHDLGAPLRNIAGMATMILDHHSKELSEDAIHWLERIGVNVEIESTMLRELVELSRTSQRAERLENIPVREIAEKLAVTLAPDLQRERIELVIADDLPVLRVDRTDLWMLIQNLTDNAIKYMGDSQTRRIIIEPLRDNDAVRGIVVRDTGPGIPESEHTRLFRAFHRASTCDGQEGSGVGLSVVLNIAERWGGEARVISSPGSGARFEISMAQERIHAHATQRDTSSPRSD